MKPAVKSEQLEQVGGIQILTPILLKVVTTVFWPRHPLLPDQRLGDKGSLKELLVILRILIANVLADVWQESEKDPFQKHPLTLKQCVWVFGWPDEGQSCEGLSSPVGPRPGTRLAFQGLLKA